MNTSSHLGLVVAGSLSEGLTIKLEAASVEDITVGRYVTIEGRSKRFLGMITDVKLGVTDEEIVLSPPSADDDFTAGIIANTSAYGALTVTPYLIIGETNDVTEGPQPVKTIPAHFAPVALSSEADIERVFGKEDDKRYYVGNPLDMETKLCLNLPEFVKRSNGIFGKSGTGKTFLTRIILIGMLQKGACVNLVFDMHSEYGWKGTHEKAKEAKGLKQLFGSKVAIFSLDKENAQQRQVATDYLVKIGYDEIEPEDIALLKQTLKMSDLAVEAAYQLRRRFDKTWIQHTLDLDGEEETEAILRSLNIHESSFQSLKRGLLTFRRLPFMQPEVTQRAVDHILGYLSSGTSVVLEFGRYTDTAAYVLVANLLTRRIYDRYRDATERAMAEDTAKPTPLVITIEEAHKFLSPEVTSQTIFGTIAREMRKYNCTLLVIDQRPSGIDSEVMSQLGTKITCLLDNERDIESVLAGISGKNELKGVLAKLSARQQALVFGHAVPMPVAFVPREYGPGHYSEFTSRSTPDPHQVETDIEELFN